MSVARGLSTRERRLAKLLGDIANLEPQAWERVQKSFDTKNEYYYERVFNSYDRIMT